MKVTIEINEPYLHILRRWASVSRTLNTAKSACTTASNLSTDYSDKEKFSWCKHELDTIEPALNYLHHIVRDKIWEEDTKK